MPNVVAVEHVSMHSATEQLPLQGLGDRRFAGTGEAGEPDHRTAMTKLRCPLTRSDFSFGPENIFAFGDGAIGVSAAEHSTARVNLVGMEQDESAEVRHPVMVVEDQRSAC